MAQLELQLDGELREADENAEYQAFVDKFKPKKTTDDCYTPPPVYDAIADWTSEEYKLDKRRFVRPFYPGGDYQKYDYPAGCVVVDNPPFSILSQICDWYNARGIPFFLFAPGLTCFNKKAGVCAVCAYAEITYENGANVRTSFLTNLDDARARSAPELYRRVMKANNEYQAQFRRELPKYEYPPEVVTAASLGILSQNGVEFAVMPEDCTFIRALDAQRQTGKSIFGGGLLLSAKAAKAAKAAKYWQLSERERFIVSELGRNCDD